MEKKKEEWQSTDSGYLNCIGVGDTYVRRQMERILTDNHLKAKNISYWPVGNNIEDGWIADVAQPQFVPKDNDKIVD